MSEFWVSKKKYFCKYCDIYIADDAPSRQQHENGLKHQGNKDRFIRGLYKEGERRKKDKEEEKREMARVELAAQAAYAQDVGSGHARPSTAGVSAPSTSSTPRKPAAKPSNPYANYSTAASLGYTDPDAEKNAARELQRQREGIISGAWEVVEPPPPPPTTTDDATDTALGKRPAEEQEDTREFKLRKRTLAAGLGKIYDPGVITLKPKKKEEPTTTADIKPATSGVPEMPRWKPAKWKRTGEEGAGVDQETAKIEESDVMPSLWKPAGQGDSDTGDAPSGGVTAAAEGTTVKAEEQPIPKEEPVDLKVELASPHPPDPAPQAPMFRKRKAVASGTRGKRST